MQVKRPVLSLVFLFAEYEGKISTVCKTPAAHRLVMVQQMMWGQLAILAGDLVENPYRASEGHRDLLTDPFDVGAELLVFHLGVNHPWAHQDTSGFD